MKIQGSRTEKNLRRAFEGESKAAMKYFLFASETRERVIKEIFLETMKNEQEHAQVFAECLEIINGTKDNLRSSVAAEALEANLDYLEMAEIAKQEGFTEISEKFIKIAKIEQTHRDRFEKYLRKLENDSLYKQPMRKQWICMKCGFIMEGLEPPLECPVCEHSLKHFKLLKED